MLQDPAADGAAHAHVRHGTRCNDNATAPGPGRDAAADAEEGRGAPKNFLGWCPGAQARRNFDAVGGRRLASLDNNAAEDHATKRERQRRAAMQVRF